MFIDLRTDAPIDRMFAVASASPVHVLERDGTTVLYRSGSKECMGEVGVARRSILARRLAAWIEDSPDKPR